ncbi:myosin-13 [Anopheles gambiae]|uniref:myosin-13 n=1 Tax=Anopheles gambiae TaxID=7165 RepID=UPI002AC8EEB1|nr:myosin-13 [Anopheles gambiae]
MDKYEENLLRLNIKIRDLITQLDCMETKNRKLQQENNVLVEDVASFRAQYALSEEGRLRCKSVLEKEIARNSEQYEAQVLLKKRYNDLIREYVAQNQKLKSYEQNALEVKQSRAKRKQAPVEIIGKLSDIGKPKAIEDKVASLEHRCSVLEKELYKAYATIDDLEFELESIDHLENTNERLEQQIKVLKAQLDQCHCEPLTPDTANSVTSPLSHDTFYQFESVKDAQQSSTAKGPEIYHNLTLDDPFCVMEENLDNIQELTIHQSSVNRASEAMEREGHYEPNKN